MKQQGSKTAWWAKALVAIACALCLMLLSACGSGGSSQSSSSLESSSSGTASTDGGGSGNATKSSSASSGSATGAAYTQPKNIAVALLAPDSGGEPSIGTDSVVDGYVTAQASSPARLKFQIKLGEQTYNYDLPNDGTQTVYPLNMGDGTYTFRIMQNTSGSNYVELYSEVADVYLSSDFSPFLVPNLYCDYSSDSDCVAKARELTSQAENYGQVVEAICTYVAANVSYDYPKAEELSNKSGYLPDPDETLNTGMGICLDYSSLSAAMLRSMGVPTKVMTGYVGDDEVYHAWIMVYIDGSWQSVMFKVDPNTWSRCDVTFASTGATKYVGDASAYTDRYTY